MRASSALAVLAALVMLIALGTGCPPAPEPERQQSPEGSADAPPELTDDVIRERIEGIRVRQIPEESSAAEPISWRLNESQARSAVVVEKSVEGSRATALLEVNITPVDRIHAGIKGRVRTTWELKTGWMLRRWEVVKMENVSMKYRKAPKADGE